METIGRPLLAQAFVSKLYGRRTVDLQGARATRSQSQNRKPVALEGPRTCSELLS